MGFPFQQLQITNTPNNTIAFIWHHAEDSGYGIRYYVLQYAKNSDFTGADSVRLIDTSYVVSLQDTIYYWRVKAIDNAINHSDWSMVWKFTIDTHFPQVPTLISPVSGIYLNDPLVLFKWTSVSFANKDPRVSSSPFRYILQVDTSLNFISPLIFDTFKFNVAILPLYENYPFYWRVRAYDLASNQGPYSNPTCGGESE